MDKTLIKLFCALTLMGVGAGATAVVKTYVNEAKIESLKGMVTDIHNIIVLKKKPGE